MPQRRLSSDRGQLQRAIALEGRAHALIPALEQLLDAPPIRGQGATQEPGDARARVERAVEPQQRARVRARVGAQVLPAELDVGVRRVNGQPGHPA